MPFLELKKEKDNYDLFQNERESKRLKFYDLTLDSPSVKTAPQNLPYIKPLEDMDLAELSREEKRISEMIQKLENKKKLIVYFRNLLHSQSE